MRPSRSSNGAAGLLTFEGKFEEMKSSRKPSKVNSKTNAKKSRSPRVAVIMGSDSDLHIMNEAAKILENFGVPYEMEIVSAHRTPHEMLEYASTAEDRGIEVIIAGAGGAAHLPGMVASATTLPVIGVPVNVTSLEGLDALLSVVQMPKGVPVATVAIDNAANAGLLAVRILASSGKEPELKAKLEKFRKEQFKKVQLANKRLRAKKKSR